MVEVRFLTRRVVGVVCGEGKREGWWQQKKKREWHERNVKFGKVESI